MLEKPADYELASLQLIEQSQQVTSARFSPNGQLLAAGGYDADVHLWRQAEDGFQTLPPLKGHQGWVSRVVFAPDGSRMVTADTWGAIRAWKLIDDPVAEIAWELSEAHDGWVRDLAVSPDGKRLASCGCDRRVCLWNVEDGKLFQEFKAHGEDVFRVAFHPSQPVLVSGDLLGRLHVWSTEGPATSVAATDGASAPTLDASVLYKYDRIQEVGGVRSLTFSPDGKVLAVGGTRPKGGGNVQGVPLVLLFDWETKKLQRTLELGANGDVYTCDLQFHPDGFVIAATSGNPGTGQVVLFRCDEDKPFLVDKKLSNCHSLSLHGNRLAVAATSKGSNGNGRKLDKDGNYAGNSSPIQVYQVTAKPA